MLWWRNINSKRSGRASHEQETCDDFSKMKNLRQVNPEEDELDGERRGRGVGGIHFMFLHDRKTISELCRLVYFRSCAVESTDCKMETAGS